MFCGSVCKVVFVIKEDGYGLFVFDGGVVDVDEFVFDDVVGFFEVIDFFS